MFHGEQPLKASGGRVPLFIVPLVLFSVTTVSVVIDTEFGPPLAWVESGGEEVPLKCDPGHCFAVREKWHRRAALCHANPDSSRRSLVRSRYTAGPIV